MRAPLSVLNDMVLLLVLIGSWLTSSHVSGLIDLSTVDFSLRTRIQILDSLSKTYESNFYETCSAAQGRCVLKHSSESFHSSTKFISDETNYGLVIGPDGECQTKSALDYVDELILSPDRSISKLLNALDASSYESTKFYLYGISKFIQKVASYPMESASEPAIHLKPLARQRVHVDYTEYKIPINSGKLIRVYAVVDKDQPQQVPLAIVLELDEEKISLVLEFIEFKLLSSTLNAACTESPEAIELVWDPVALPVGHNCSLKLLEEFKQGARTPLVSGRLASYVQFSFGARTLTKEGHQHEHTQSVAYAGHYSTMRVDTLCNSIEPKKRADLFDFARDKHYLFPGHDNHKSSQHVSWPGDAVRATPDAFSQEENQINLQWMLLGAQHYDTRHRWTYIGMARVRGNTLVRAYESTNAQLPVWAAPTSTSSTIISDEPEGADSATPSISVVAYFVHSNSSMDEQEYNDVSKVNSDDNEDPLYYAHARLDSSWKLAMIDYYRQPQAGLFARAHVLDFKWRARPGDTNQELDDERFTLHSLAQVASQDCATCKDALAGGSGHFSVQMSVEQELSSDVHTNSWWSRLTQLEQKSALLSAVADSIKAYGYVYDLQFKQKLLHTRLAMQLEFKFLSRPSTLRDIKFQSRGFVRESDQSKALLHAVRGIDSLIECVEGSGEWMSSNNMSLQHMLVYFSDKKRECQVDAYTKLNETVGQYQSQAIVRNRQGDGRIYLFSPYPDNIHQMVKFALDRRDIQLEHWPPTSGNDSVIKLVPTRVDLDGSGGHDDEEDSPRQRHFEGFALVAGTPNTRQVVGDPSADNSTEVNQVTLSTCETECLNDLNCHTYSYCNLVGGAGSECVLTNSSLLESAQARDTLKQAAAAGTKRRRFVIRVPSEQQAVNTTIDINVERNIRCELNSKSVIRMFKRENGGRETFVMMLAVRVRNLEQCAQACFKSTTNAVYRADALHRDYLALISQSAYDSKTARRLLEESLQITKAVCKQFKYLSGTLNDQKTQVIGLITDDRQAPDVDGAGTKTGRYCILDDTYRWVKLNDTQKELIGHTYFRAEKYKFDHTNLYVSYDEVRMRPTEDKLQSVVEEVASGNKSESNLDTLRKALDEGKNLQLTREVSKLHLDSCAGECFVQTSGLWPWCRSFDQSFDSSVRAGVEECFFNTATIEQRANVIANNSGDIKFRHYELRAFGKLNQDDYNMEYHDNGHDTDNNNDAHDDWSLSSLWVSVCLMLGLGLGVSGGVYLSTQLRAPARRRMRSSSESDDMISDIN